MTPEETKAKYVEALNAIIANDPITGPLYAERAALQAQIAPALNQMRPSQARISQINNIINNTASNDVQKALAGLRAVRK